MDEVTWAALTATLTALGAAWTVYAFRTRGVASGLRGAGLTLIPPAAYLTGTLEVVVDVGQSVLTWATHLVFSPLVWLGVVLAGLSVLCLGVSAGLRQRGRGGKPGGDDSSTTKAPRELPASRTRGEPAIDDDLADIEAILKKRGIT